MAGLLILAIESAAECGGVALTRGGLHQGRVLAEYTLQVQKKHSRPLLSLVASIMEASGCLWRDLDAVAVSQGPGSFTGLRVGMAAAKGMAYASGKPLIAVPTLDAVARQLFLPPKALACCLLDARKNQVYAAFYRYGAQSQPQRVSQYLALSPAALAARFNEPLFVAGPGLRVCAELFAAHPLVHAAPWAAAHPRAAMIGCCAAELFAANQKLSAADEALPLYVRSSETELELRKPEGLIQP